MFQVKILISCCQELRSGNAFIYLIFVVKDNKNTKTASKGLMVNLGVFGARQQSLRNMVKDFWANVFFSLPSFSAIQLQT